MKLACLLFVLFAFSLSPPLGAESTGRETDEAPLRLSVYATAGGILTHLATEADVEHVVRTLAPLRVSRLFLEGRRGDETVPAAKLNSRRILFEKHGFQCSGGIATVPGANFGTRQNEALGWLNWESARTQQDIRGFFTENAPIFPEMIVDDFFCTADTSSTSVQARGERGWSEYRRDLLVSLIDPIMRQPARAANPMIRLIIKFPQWYDRFQLFGYDPARMAAPFDQVWVGTEVRNPKTRRMGFVQPTEGYVNFRWLSAVAGDKVVGAWFDHIECTPENFIDQAFQSVLAGARELTLFNLGDVLGTHPGDLLLAARLPELMDLASKVRGRERRGVAFYKPPGSSAGENLYLMDYLTMLGLPILPEARYPDHARVAFFGFQASADPSVLSKMRQHVEKGGTIILTPALVRQLGDAGATFAGISINRELLSAITSRVMWQSGSAQLDTPLELDGSLRATTSRVQMTAQLANSSVPLLTSRDGGSGRVLVLNVRTFSEEDFRDANEWLLAPKPRGLSELPEAVANVLRHELVSPLQVRLESPSGVSLYLFRGANALYNFRDEPVRVKCGDQNYELAAHQCRWLEEKP